MSEAKTIEELESLLAELDSRDDQARGYLRKAYAALEEAMDCMIGMENMLLRAKVEELRKEVEK